MEYVQLDGHPLAVYAGLLLVFFCFEGPHHLTACRGFFLLLFFSFGARSVGIHTCILLAEDTLGTARSTAHVRGPVGSWQASSPSVCLRQHEAISQWKFVSLVGIS